MFMNLLKEVGFKPYDNKLTKHNSRGLIYFGDEFTFQWKESLALAPKNAGLRLQHGFKNYNINLKYDAGKEVSLWLLFSKFDQAKYSEEKKKFKGVIDWSGKILAKYPPHLHEQYLIDNLK